MSLTGLVGMIITTIVGAGIFNLSKEMAMVSSPGGITMGWMITGVGMGALALAMQGLSQMKPELESGIFSFAREGFGDYVGFNSAWGYWLSAVIKNAAYGTLMFSAISYFAPIFENGQNVYSIVGASIMLWWIHWNVLKGTKSNERLNLIILVMKLTPILLFLIVAIVAFRYDLFTQDFWGNMKTYQEIGGLIPQMKNTMLVTVFTFGGIESAIAFSGKAEKHSDVGKATLLGFASVTLIYALVTILSFGIMSREEIINLPNPAMAYIMERVLGKPGAIIVNLGVIISILGAWISSTMLCEEVFYQSSHQDLFPKFFDKRNQNLVSLPSLTLSNLIVQALFITFLLIPNAYSSLTKLSSANLLISYLCIALYFSKVIFSKGHVKNSMQILIAIVSTVYMLWLLYASGVQFISLTIISLFPGTIMFIMTRIFHKRKVFTTFEWGLFVAMAIGLIWSITQINHIF